MKAKFDRNLNGSSMQKLYVPNKTNFVIAGTLLLSISVSLIFLSGCATTKLQLTDIPIDSPGGAIFMISELYNNLERFESGYSLKFSFGEFRNTFSGKYKISKPGKFFCNVQGPFGLNAGSITVNEELFEIRLGKGEIISGAADTLDLEKIVGFPLPSSDPEVLFFPLAIQPESDALTIAFEKGEDPYTWTLDLLEDNRIHQFVIDISNRTVLIERWLTEDGITIIEKSFREYDELNGTLLPGEIKIIAPGRMPVDITLKLKSSKVNPKWKNDPFIFEVKSENESKSAS